MTRQSAQLGSELRQQGDVGTGNDGVCPEQKRRSACVGGE